MDIYDRQAAYQAVIQRIRDTQNLRANRAPQSWLADRLRIARQMVYRWEATGFPDIHAEKIAELLDMDPMEVCPHMPVYLPDEVFHAVIDRSTKKKPFGIKLVEVIQAGLKRRASHG